MLEITLDGIHPGLDGSYHLDLAGENLTAGELHEIKKLTGLRVGEFEEAAEARDTDLVVAFALVALRRAGKKPDPYLLWEAPVGRILISERADAGPPATPGGPNTSGAGPARSGGSSPASTGHPGNGQSPTGTQASVTGATSDPATWGP